MAGKVIGDFDKKLAESGDDHAQNAKGSLSQAGTDLEPTFAKIGERIRATGAAMGDAFKNTFNNSADMIDASVIANVASEIKKVSEELRKGAQEKGNATPAGGRLDWRERRQRASATQLATRVSRQHDLGSLGKRHHCRRGREDRSKHRSPPRRQPKRSRRR